MENLKKWVQETLLIPEELKQKLKAVEWTEEVKNLVQKIYLKYAKLEKKIVKDLSGRMTSFYVSAIKFTESKWRQKELEELKRIEEKIKNL